MKKITLSLILLMALMIIPTIALATEEIAVEIGETEYATLNEAIENANSGDTITLIRDLELVDRIIIQKDDNITLDLNGKTLTLPTYESNYQVVVHGSLTIIGEGTVDNIGIYGIGVQTTGNLTIQNGTFNSITGDYLIGCWGKTVIEDGTFNGDYCIANGFNDGTVEIKGGTFKHKGDHFIVAGNVKISEGTFNRVIYTNYLANNANITVNLDANAELYETITVPTGSKYTINLNGNNITGENKLFDVKGAEFTVTGTGTLEENSPFYAPIYISGDTAQDTIVNIGSDVTLRGWSGVMLSSDAAAAQSIEVNCDAKIDAVNDINGGTGIGIYVNGYLQNSNNCPVINLSSTTNVMSTGNAIYAAGYADWNINSSSLEGVEAALAIKAGRFNIENATVLSTGEDMTPTDGYNNGVYPSGAAIQIESNDAYYGGIYLNIKNGTFTSNQGNGLYEYLAVNTELGIDTQNTYVKELNLENSKFVSAKDSIKVSSDFKTKITKFIKGGTYSTDVTDYLADGYVYKNTAVLKENTITSITANGTVSLDKIFGTLGDTINITTKPDEGFEVGSVIVKDANGNQITVTDNSFVMPDSAVTIEVVFKEYTQETNIPSQVVNSEEVKEILLDALKENEEFAELIKNNNVEVKVDLKEVELEEENKEKIQEKLDTKAENIKVVKYLDITIAVKAGEAEKNLSELGEEITFVITLPQMPKLQDGYIRNYYIVREHNGELEFIDAKLSEDEKSIEFASSKFSTYAIAYIDVEDENQEQEPGTNPGGAGIGESEPEGSEPDGTEPEENKPEAKPEQEKEDTKQEETKPSSNIPVTGDNIVLYVVIAIASLFGIIVLKKAKHKKSKH